VTRDRTQHCCTCGEKRRPTQAPVPSLNNGTPIVSMALHRPMLDGRWEDRPQLLVNVGIWRNGGTAPGQTHICEGCLLVGLREAKRWVDDAIDALEPQADRDAT
jgi:hypothetical protein